MPFSFSLDSVGYSVFVGAEAMFRRRKSTSPAKTAVCKKETRQRLRLWGELGKIGEIANLWRFADFTCRDMATVSLLATLSLPQGRVTYHGTTEKTITLSSQDTGLLQDLYWNAYIAGHICTMKPVLHLPRDPHQKTN